MTYAAQLAAISRTPVQKAIITLDWCARTFGEGSCTATGTPCYNTYFTCRDRANFSRTTKNYTFTSATAPLPDRTGERPYIDRISYLPTEITDNLTVKGRTKITLHDEDDTDIGIDPYVADRASVQGTFWKKLLARNPNYKGRPVALYDGFYGAIVERRTGGVIWQGGVEWPTVEAWQDGVIWQGGVEWQAGVEWPARSETNSGVEWEPRSTWSEREASAFEQTHIGVLDNITLARGTVTVETKDLLKSLDDIEVPAKLDVKLSAAIDDSQTSITLAGTQVSSLDSSGYVRIDDEIISYTSLNTTTGIISGGARAQFGTAAAAHSENDKVQGCRYYAPANPFDILQEMLATDGGITSGYIDSAQFATVAAWPGDEIDISAIVSEPMKLSDLYFEIVDLIDCKSWVGEDLKITIERNLANHPDRTYETLTDDENIVDGTGSVDRNEESRLTRVSLYWDKTATGALDDPAEYARLAIAVDSDAEGTDGYNDTAEKVFWCRWLRSDMASEEILSGFVERTIKRYLLHRLDAKPILSIQVEMKDQDIRTGQFVRITTDEIQDRDGSDYTREAFQVIRREPKNDGTIALKAVHQPKRRICIAAPVGTPAYDSATEAQKEYGFASDINGLIDGEPGYYAY